MIPKKIHYCWFGNNPLPQDVKKCIESWKKYCPEYEIIQWNESNYDISKHPFMKASYEKRNWAFVSDYARLDIIYMNGGIYLDTDVELRKNLDFLLKDDCYFGVQQQGSYVATGLGFGSVAGHSAVRMMLNQYDAVTFDTNKKEELACPYLNTNALVPLGYKKNEDKIQVIGEGVYVYPPCYFDPLSPGQTENLLCGDTVSIHHYSATWMPFRKRLKRKIFRMIGQEKIHKIKHILGRV